MPIEFGAVAPCRTCGGAGKGVHNSETVRNLEEDGKVHRRKVCPECHGQRFLPIKEADRPRDRSGFDLDHL